MFLNVKIEHKFCHVNKRDFLANGADLALDDIHVYNTRGRNFITKIMVDVGFSLMSYLAKCLIQTKLLCICNRFISLFLAQIHQAFL